MIDGCSHTFERSFIIRRIRQGRTACPISGKELTEDGLIPNDRLAERIEKWKWEQRMIRTGEWDSLEDCHTTETEHSSFDDEELGLDQNQTTASVELTSTRKPPRRSLRAAKGSSPSRFMLLPQEVAALERQYEIDAETQRQRKCQQRQRTILLIFITAVVVGGGIAFARFMRSNVMERK